MPANLILVDEIDSFKKVRDYPADTIGTASLEAVRLLDEREQLEPFIQSILSDTNHTPHGPMEIADILTHKMTVKGESGLSAFILKGKSFPTVRAKDVAHQVFKLERITGLKNAVFAATGTVLDEVKEIFVRTADRGGWNYAVLDANDIARLLEAYGFLCPKDGRRIEAGRCPECGYSPKYRILNPFQNESLKELIQTRKIGHSAGLVVLPTGSGKTRIAALDAHAFGCRRVLYVAHTDEILDVAKSEFDSVFGTAKVTRHFSASSLSRPNVVNIATVQLVARHLSEIKAGKIEYLVVDEFHHAAAKTYRKLIEHCEPDFLLGLTATPFRGDRQDILLLCNNNLVVNFELRSGIDAGILCPYHYFGCFDSVDYSSIKHNGMSYDVRDLERALIIPERDKAIIAKWQEMCSNRPTLAFCCSHLHAERVAASFRDSGISAETYLSTTNSTDRLATVQKCLRAELRVICVVDVLNEGADLPFIDCLLFLRPTESERIFYQQLGRGLRKYVGKSHCTVIDFIGNFRNAFKIVQYQGLRPLADDPETSASFTRFHNYKEALTLPLGCKVEFDDKVVDVFARQTLDYAHATRHNIGRILIYQYQRLWKSLGRRPLKRDVDRMCLLHVGIYEGVFGSWKKFESVVATMDSS